MRKISRLGPDDVIFSGQGTKKAYSLYKGAEHVLDLCTIAGGILGGGYGGIPCGVASIGTDFLAAHADECSGKIMCLKLKDWVLPFCVGRSECCSEALERGMIRRRGWFERRLRCWKESAEMGLEASIICLVWPGAVSVTEFTICMHERSNACSAKKAHVTYAVSVCRSSCVR